MLTETVTSERPIKVIYHAISKALLYNCKDPEKPRVVLFGPTEK